MTIRRAVLLCCVLTVGVVAGQARAATMPYIGISQSFQDYGLKNGVTSKDVSASTFWGGLHVGSLRVIVPWDIAGRPTTDPERKDFEHFLQRVAALQLSEGITIDPFVVFGPTENKFNAIDGTDGWNDDGYVAPKVTTYQTAIHQFLALYGPQGSLGLPKVRIIGAWNEPNRGDFHMQLDGAPAGEHPVIVQDGQRMDSPTCPSPASATNCGPRAAAYYWKTARDEMSTACTGSGLSCYAVAGEFTSGFASTSQSYWQAYSQQIDNIISTNYPTQISFHGHQDVDPLGASNDCVSGGPLTNCITYVFDHWLSQRGGAWANRTAMAIWNTEVHSFYTTTSGSTPGDYQRNRFEHLVDLSNTYHVKRIYYFNFQAQGSDDYGLIAQGDINAAGANRPLWWYIHDRS